MVKLYTGNCLLQLPGCYCRVCCTSAATCPELPSSVCCQKLLGVLKAARAVLTAFSHVLFCNVPWCDRDDPLCCPQVVLPVPVMMWSRKWCCHVLDWDGAGFWRPYGVCAQALRPWSKERRELNQAGLISQPQAGEIISWDLICC